MATSPPACHSHPGLGQKYNVCPRQEGLGGHSSHWGGCREEVLVLPEVASSIYLVPALGLLSTITEQKLLGEMLRITFSDTLHHIHRRRNLRERSILSMGWDLGLNKKVKRHVLSQIMG